HIALEANLYGRFPETGFGPLPPYLNRRRHYLESLGAESGIDVDERREFFLRKPFIRQSGQQVVILDAWVEHVDVPVQRMTNIKAEASSGLFLRQVRDWDGAGGVILRDLFAGASQEAEDAPYLALGCALLNHNSILGGQILRRCGGRSESDAKDRDIRDQGPQLASIDSRGELFILLVRGHQDEAAPLGRDCGPIHSHRCEDRTHEARSRTPAPGVATPPAPRFSSGRGRLTVLNAPCKRSRPDRADDAASSLTPPTTRYTVTATADSLFTMRA